MVMVVVVVIDGNGDDDDDDDHDHDAVVVICNKGQSTSCHAGQNCVEHKALAYRP